MSATTEVALPVAPIQALPKWFEILFGLLLPIFCFVADLGILRISTAAPLALWGAAALGIVAMLLSYMSLPRSALELTAGILTAAGFVSLIVGIGLMPLAFVGMFFYGIGLLGFVPLLTALVFYQRGAQLGKSLGFGITPLFIAGVVLLIGLPVAAQAMEYRWISTQTAAIYSGDRERRTEAFRALKNYPLDLGRTARIACEYAQQGVRSPVERPGYDPTDPDMVREFTEIFGYDIGTQCRAILD